MVIWLRAGIVAMRVNPAVNREVERYISCVVKAGRGISMISTGKASMPKRRRI